MVKAFTDEHMEWFDMEKLCEKLDEKRINSFSKLKFNFHLIYFQSSSLKALIAQLPGIFPAPAFGSIE